MAETLTADGSIETRGGHGHSTSHRTAGSQVHGTWGGAVGRQWSPFCPAPHSPNTSPSPILKPWLPLVDRDQPLRPPTHWLLPEPPRLTWDLALPASPTPGTSPHCSPVWWEAPRPPQGVPLPWGRTQCHSDSLDSNPVLHSQLGQVPYPLLRRVSPSVTPASQKPLTSQDLCR